MKFNLYLPPFASTTPANMTQLIIIIRAVFSMIDLLG